MVTTKIEYKNGNLIRFNPVDLGHSSIYQEFKTKLFTKYTSNTHGNDFIYTTTQSIDLTIKNIQGDIKQGYYYPYITFTQNGKFNKILLVPKKERPLNSKYYTRINKLIYIKTNKTFESFTDIILINNMPNDTYMLNYMNNIEQKLAPVDNYVTYPFTIKWWGNTIFTIENNPSKHLKKIVKHNTTTLHIYFIDGFLEKSDVIDVILSVNASNQGFNLVATSDMLVETVHTIQVDNDFIDNYLQIRAIDSSNTALTFLNNIGSFHNRCDIIIRKKI